MSEEIWVNAAPWETRVAVLENNILQEIHMGRSSHQELVGNVYQGRVVKVLSGMQAAFVDIGLDQPAFLQTVRPDKTTETDLEKKDPQKNTREVRFTEGQTVLVQVIQEAVKGKAPKLTTQLSFSSRYLVLMPGLNQIRISSRIQSREERERLRELLSNEWKPPNTGYIVRTVAEGVLDFRADQVYLKTLWESLQEKSKKARCGTLLYQELPFLLRILRDCVGQKTQKIRIDGSTEMEQARQFIEDYIPDFTGQLEHYTGDSPLFELNHLESEIQRSLQRRVELKSGGFLVFDQTEAMITIDVNTGAFTGRRNLEETALKTNLEAASGIARQLRLRNLGGMIIIDFIDMVNEDHREQVLRALERELARDRVKTSISDMSPLGLVQMTRKRTHGSLSQILCETCGTCQGRGHLKTIETICYEIFREILKVESRDERRLLRILAAPAVADRLLDEMSKWNATSMQKRVQIQPENLYSQEQFDVVLM